MSSFLEAALSYAARGWPVLPLQGKIPLTAHGVKDATVDEAVIRAWWQRWPKANVGIACGQASGLLVVDVDARSGGLDTLAGYDLAPTLTVETGGGGLHLYYRWPDVPIVGGKGRFGAGIDCQGEGRYVVAPPSIHPETGQPYRWAGDGDPEAMPQKLIAIGTAPKVTLPVLSRPAVMAPVDVVERARRYVSQMRGSVSGQGGHDSLFRVCCALVNGFDLDIASARRIVDDYNATKAQPAWSDKEITHKLDDAAKDGTFNGRPRGCLLTARHADRSDPLPVAAIVVADRKRREMAQSKAAPAHLLEPPGLVGEVARWIDSCSVHRVPLLSVAGALCAVAVACGRRYRLGGVRPVLYLVGVAESGVGKETSRQCAMALLTAAGLESRVGTDDVSSAAALSAMLTANPIRLLLLDELGRMLEAYSSRTAASFERQIVTALIRLWSCANGKYLGKGMAQKSPPPIEQPHLTMYATTTPGSLHRSLRGADVSDGVLSRMLLVPVDHGRQRGVNPVGTVAAPPGELVAQVKALATPALEGNVASVDHGSRGHDVSVDVALSPDAADLLEQMHDYVDGALESDRDHRELWVRAEEQAQRVALVLAVGCGSHVLEVSHLQWGWDFVRWSIGRSREVVASHMAETPEDAARQAILRALERGPMTKSQVTRLLQRVDKRTREAALATALDSGAVVCEAVTSRTRSAQVYRLATAAENFATTFAGLEDSES